MTALVLDLSHHNTIPASLSGAKSAGIIGIIHKATEGISFKDSKLSSRHYLASESDMEWGVYHFLTPGNIPGQVDAFLSYTKSVSDERTLFAADYENSKVPLSDLQQFLDMVAAKTGRLPVLYSGNTLKEALKGQANPNLSKHRLWLAQYGPKTTLPPGWDRYWLWQYTETGNIPGIGPTVDISRYDGTVDELRSEWPGPPISSSSQKPAEPPPSEVVEEPSVTVTIEAPPGIKVNIVQR
jgi:lysozyme